MIAILGPDIFLVREKKVLESIYVPALSISGLILVD